MPFDNLAANDHSRPLEFRLRICCGKLRQMPYDSRMDCGRVRSQRHRIHPDGNAHVTDADSLCIVPSEQQLLAQFGGLLRVPCAGVSEHHEDRRSGAESRYRWFPDDSLSVCDLPPDNYLGRGSVQSQCDGIPANQWARWRGLRSLPYQ